MSATETDVTVSLTLDEFMAIGEQLGRLRGRVGWLEYRVEELLRANDALVERVRRAETGRDGLDHEPAGEQRQQVDLLDHRGAGFEENAFVDVLTTEKPAP